MSPTVAERNTMSVGSLDKLNLLDSDLLLFLGRNLISRAGRSDYSHAAKAIWWHGTPMCVEVREWKGGRAVTLESQVRKRPGQIVVYRTNPQGDENYNRRVATNRMIEMAGCDYGYFGVLSAALLHLPFISRWVKPDLDDKSADNRPPFCSQACAMADQFGGVDPVPNLSNRITEPADLARSMFYKYQFTLVV